MQLLIFSRYTASQASTRVRFLQFLPHYQAVGLDVVVVPVLGDSAIAGRAGGLQQIQARLVSILRTAGRLLRSRCAPAWVHVHIELFPWLPYAFEHGVLLLAGCRHFSIELDDAWFHRYDRSANALVRRLLGRKIDRLMAASSLVIAGNEYIAERARSAGAARVVVSPTVVDAGRYAPTSGFQVTATVPVVGWIGSPSTTEHLLDIADVISSLAEAGVARFVAIGADSHALRGLPITVLPWREESEVADLQALDIGIMPLQDSLFERGKCGYKLVQYMACGKPVVAASVGANCEIVLHGQVGFLAANAEDWDIYLRRLCADSALRARLGEAGRVRVQQHYSVAAVAPKLVAALQEVVNQ